MDTLTGLTEEEKDLIIGTMERWANGEPVWPYAEIIEHWGREFKMYREAWADPVDTDIRRAVGRSMIMFQLRDTALHQFGFAIPCRELLNLLKQHQPIVEIGAGSGYMTKLMRNHGIEVIGTDSGWGHYSFTVGQYDPQQLQLQGKTAVRRYPDHTVFCSWPTLQHTWFRQALRAVRIGQHAIIIEEDACANETTWDYRDNSFNEVLRIPIPAWNYMNDRCALWQKKRHHVMRVPKLEVENAERDARMKRFLSTPLTDKISG